MSFPRWNSAEPAVTKSLMTMSFVVKLLIDPPGAEKVVVAVSVGADMTDDDATKIIERRNGGIESVDPVNAEPFETLEQFKTFMLNDLKKASFSQANATANLSVSSNYFLLEAIAQIGNNRSTLYSIIQRDDTGKCHVIARSQGVW